jgi:hypothetical protein
MIVTKDDMNERKNYLPGYPLVIPANLVIKYHEIGGGDGKENIGEEIYRCLLHRVLHQEVAGAARPLLLDSL